MARRLDRGQIRLYRFASPDKQCPVLILTRSSAVRYLNKVTVAPISSTIRDAPSEVRLDGEDGMKSPCAINLFNLVTVSQGGLGRLVAQLSRPRMREVCGAVSFSLGCDDSIDERVWLDRGHQRG